jgi:two-component system nitrogen regulation response regulator GlnG
VLIADDEESIRFVLREALESAGHRVDEVATGDAALDALADGRYDLAFLDIRMPGPGGLDLLQRLEALGVETAAVIITAQNTMENAVEAMKRGALDYLVKPFSLATATTLAQKALRTRRLHEELRDLRREIGRGPIPGGGRLVGKSPAMLEIFKTIGKVAIRNVPVLITGESGTGKELVAQAIHYNGPRGKRTFVSENCAAIPDTLLQSELFGHVRGAFTGADRDRAGLFEQAHEGTLFLDEIGDMSPTMQAQILRALQEGEIRRVGGTTPISVDVRVIAATHRDLQQETAAGRFREDLLYRLQVLLIELPPLRERRGDVRRLTRYFLQRIAAERDKSIQGMDADMLERLERYSWPGNVRQLQNTLQRLSLLAGDGPIGADLLVLDTGLRELLDNGDSGRAGVAVAPLSLSSSERDRIVEALRAAEGNRSRAARLLGVSRATIYRKIKELKL